MRIPTYLTMQDQTSTDLTMTNVTVVKLQMHYVRSVGYFVTSNAVQGYARKTLWGGKNKYAYVNKINKTSAVKHKSAPKN